MPKLWSATLEEHRRAVRDATLDATWVLVDVHGLRAVTMSQIAAGAGIGRATLYKYFPDVEAILRAWHEREITRHLAQLAALRDRPGKPFDRLTAVLHAYAHLHHRPRGHHGPDLAAFFHDGEQEQVGRAHQQLLGMLHDLLADAVAAGSVRDDVAPAELATYCVHALAAVRDLPSEAAVQRLVAVTLAGLRPPP